MVNFLADRVQSSGVVFLPRLLEAIVADGATVVRFAAVVFSEPSISSRQSVEMVNQSLVVLWRMRVEQIAFPDHCGPRRKVVGDDAMTGLSQRLRYSGRAGEAIEDGARLHLLDKLQDVRQQLELGPGVFDSLRLSWVQIKVLFEQSANG